jgi:hypothetical protein
MNYDIIIKFAIAFVVGFYAGVGGAALILLYIVSRRRA